MCALHKSRRNAVDLLVGVNWYLEGTGGGVSS